ncbi:enoyl-CoA hydratase/isomerase family protein [soil metagenome]
MPVLLTETRAAVLTLTLNRPEVRNALSWELREALREAFETARDDEDVRVVVLTGAGKAFCSGLDLGELGAIQTRSSEENLADSVALAALFKLIYTFPKPVIAAVNGHALAGGAGLASVCDLTIMSDAAKLGYTEARIGFVAALVGVFLVRQVSEKAARDLLLSARLVTAQEALGMGLVNEVRPPDEVLPRAFEFAQSLRANSPTSLALTKRLLATVPSLGLDEGLSYATNLNALSRTTADLAEGVAAFLEKRAPAWAEDGE